MGKFEELQKMIALLLEGRNFVVFDTESTGFNPTVKGRDGIAAKLIEIGAVKVVDGEIVDEFEALIDPERKISKRITEVTGISNEMVKGKDTYPKVISDFYRFAKGSILVLHNAPHDLGFMNFFGKTVGIDFSDFEYIDTVELAKEFIAKGNRTKPYSLESLAELFGISDENHHRAKNDAEVTAHVMLKLKEIAKKRCGERKLVRQEKLINNSDRDNLIYQADVVHTSYWQKDTGKMMYKRLYIKLRTKNKDGQTEEANVYWDFMTQNWGVKDTTLPLVDFSTIKEKVLKHCHKSESSLESSKGWS